MIDYSLPIFDRLQDCWDPVDERQLAELETRLQVALPDDFKQFLQVFNAGQWSHGVKIDISHCDPDSDELHLYSNLGVVSEKLEWAMDIAGVRAAYEDRFPRTFLPIMRSSPELIGLHCGSDQPGRVMYWNHTWNDDNEADIVPLADTFAALISMLHPSDDIEFYREKLPAFQAVERGDKSALAAFLADGGKSDLRNLAGWTLAMCAARKSWPKLLGMLLEARADPNALDAENRTPLLHAIDGDSFDSVKLLVAAGADVQFRDAQGRTLAEIARQEHSHRIARFFEAFIR